MENQAQAFIADLETQPAYSHSTRLAYQNDLRGFSAFLRRTLGREPALADFNAQQAANFLEAERQAGRRPSTLLRRRACLRRFAAFLRRSEPDWAAAFDDQAYLLDDAISASGSGQALRYLDSSQIDALWGLLDSSPRPRARRDSAILALLLESGLTVGTLIALNLNDLDPRTERLRVLLDDGGELWLPLASASLALQRYLREGRPELNCRPDEPALFISQTGGRMSRQGVWQVLRQWGHRAHLPITLSPRLARHTAAVHLAQAGRPLSEIQALLGHSNPLSTQALLRRLTHPPKETPAAPPVDPATRQPA